MKWLKDKGGGSKQPLEQMTDVPRRRAEEADLALEAREETSVDGGAEVATSNAGVP